MAKTASERQAAYKAKQDRLPLVAPLYKRGGTRSAEPRWLDTVAAQREVIESLIVAEKNALVSAMDLDDLAVLRTGYAVTPAYRMRLVPRSRARRIEPRRGQSPRSMITGGNQVWASKRAKRIGQLRGEKQADLLSKTFRRKRRRKRASRGRFSERVARLASAEGTISWHMGY